MYLVSSRPLSAHGEARGLPLALLRCPLPHLLLEEEFANARVNLQVARACVELAYLGDFFSEVFREVVFPFFSRFMGELSLKEEVPPTNLERLDPSHNFKCKFADDIRFLEFAFLMFQEGHPTVDDSPEDD